jgi:hypothetical protein
MERERERERQQHAATWVEEEPELQNQAGKLNIEMTYCTPGLPCALFWYLSKWSSFSTMFLGLGCSVEMNGERWIFMWCFMRLLPPMFPFVSNNGAGTSIV